jgi:hypothetical protein
MKMYEDLIKTLRSIDEYDTGYAKLIYDAADAIEELSKPKWIPVTERLPEEAYACLAIVWDNNPYSGDTFLNYYPEFVGYGGGSWNDYNGDEIPLDVVYWMKLPQIPEPPKEET